MGKLEKNAKRRKRNKDFQGAVLGVVALTGVIATGGAIGQVVGGFMRTKADKDLYRHHFSAKRAINRLVDKGLLKYEKTDRGTFLSLTKDGERYMQLLDEKTFEIKKPRKWDKRWRMIIFDIPEKYRKKRDKARRMFERAGLYRLQDSVWIHPYDCEEFVLLLKSELQIGNNILYVIADTIENDKYLKDHFEIA